MRGGARRFGRKATSGRCALRRCSPDIMSRGSIAGGEVLTRRQSFQPWLEAGAFDIVQPDVTKVGGISEERRIAWMAREHGVRFIPHGWNTAVGLAADLQLASAFPETDLVEYLNGSPFIDEIVATPWKLDSDGMLNIPEKPGLGLELNRDAIAEYTPREPTPARRGDTQRRRRRRADSIRMRSIFLQTSMD